MRTQNNTNNATGASPSVSDPILDAISAYLDGCAAYDAVHPNDFEKYGGEEGLIENLWSADGYS